MNLITGFEYPNYFYGATALFLLIGFYWLRRRATQKRVSAIFLWGPTEVSPQSGLRFKISVLPLSFYLEAAALLLIVLAATAPFRMAEENYPVLALVLDNSFSMRSTTPGGTSPQRRGVEELKKRLSSQPGRRVLAILAGDEPRLLSDGKLLPDLEAVWTVDDSFSDIPGAIALARKRSPGCEILVISDHAPDFELSDDTGYFAEGRLLGNTALVNVRRYKDSILCEVLNASLSPKAIQVKLNPGGVSPTIELKPHERRKIVVQISADDIDREIEVVLQDTDDPLEFDNRLITLPEKRYPIQIGYAGNLPETAKSELDKVLADNPDFTLSTTPELLFGVPGLEVGAYHRFIWNLGMANRSVVSAESISARPNQELIRGLSVQGLRWNADADLRLPGEILLRSDDIELLSLRRRFDGYCDIYLNLDPKKSNLKNRPFWPAFFWNVAEYLQLERPGPKQSNSRRGEIIECKIADPSLREVQVFCPDGTVRRVVPFRRRVLLANLPPGVSTIKVGDESYKVAVSPLSVAESTLEKSGEFRREAQKIRQLDESPRIHLYWIALLAALTVLAVHQYQFGIKRGER